MVRGILHSAVVIVTATSLCGSPFASQLCVSLARLFVSRRNYYSVFALLGNCCGEPHLKRGLPLGLVGIELIGGGGYNAFLCGSLFCM